MKKLFCVSLLTLLSGCLESETFLTAFKEMKNGNTKNFEQLLTQEAKKELGSEYSLNYLVNLAKQTQEIEFAMDHTFAHPKATAHVLLKQNDQVVWLHVDLHCAFQVALTVNNQKLQPYSSECKIESIKQAHIGDSFAAAKLLLAAMKCDAKMAKDLLEQNNLDPRKKLGRLHDSALEEASARLENDESKTDCQATVTTLNQ